MISKYGPVATLTFGVFITCTVQLQCSAMFPSDCKLAERAKHCERQWARSEAEIMSRADENKLRWCDVRVLMHT